MANYQSQYTGEQIDEAVGKALSASGGGGGSASLPNAIFINNAIIGGHATLPFKVSKSISPGPAESVTASNVYFCAVGDSERIVIKPYETSISSYSVVGECTVNSNQDTSGNYNWIDISNIKGIVFISIVGGDPDPL